MSKKVKEIEPGEANIEFEFKKLEFDRSFGHLSALDTRISIAIAVETLILGIMIQIIIALFEGKIPRLLFYCLPVFWFLILPLVCNLVSIILTLRVLFFQMKYEFPEINPKDSSEAANEIKKYVNEAKDERKKRHKFWKWALGFLIASIVLLTKIVILLIISGICTM